MKYVLEYKDVHGKLYCCDIDINDSHKKWSLLYPRLTEGQSLSYIRFILKSITTTECLSEYGRKFYSIKHVK